MEPTTSADPSPDLNAPKSTSGDAAGEGSESDPSPVSSSSSVSAQARPSESQPSFVFFAVVASVALLVDIGTKVWAEVVLSQRNPLEPAMVLLEDHLAFRLAYNQGGAWGLLQNADEAIRKPFFFIVSIAAVAFIVSLYSRISTKQLALKWGLPLVLGGALGNLTDRIVRSSVVDFIDYRADWVGTMNSWIAKLIPSWDVWDHWPTFNVADVAICVGVGLMAVDMFTTKRRLAQEEAEEELRSETELPQAAEPSPSEPPRQA